ncbi:response regulator transcription factor [Chitinophaga nivalis]|uniref:Helix-turn-helix transcriptional regulator n=1 Tax=Chitinophaga nivalis TaxID=2991709 RepID=A0ABT3IS42_9BACT|nr:helix-turn-helix transcriptional regulator [Chitinophaga nivalis]MCW3463503.1 helix-turn-helix transcriptional regulator [Chitinophaga nivalis]MCW3486807.1 helix-turn-helix transcriptional regulator [Chitinophaga nivalis]
MHCGLNIKISSPSGQENREVVFFEPKEWNTDSERDLIARLQQLFLLLRAESHAIHILIKVETSDVIGTEITIRKKIQREQEICYPQLSAREIEILGLIMKGYTNQEIAIQLNISFETVRSHRKNILGKTGAKNTAALIHYYHQTFFEK